MTLTLNLGRDPCSPLDVVCFGGKDYILFERRVALCERRVPANARSLEGGGLDCCHECDRRHAALERRRQRDRHRRAPRLRLA
jgi:hypothetical protein